jgi:hypothetical protein
MTTPNAQSIRSLAEGHRQATLEARREEAELAVEDSQLQAEHGKVEGDLAAAEVQLAAHLADQLRGPATEWGLPAEGVTDASQLASEPIKATFSSVWENQRRSLGFSAMDFSEVNLLRTERAGWTDGQGQPAERARLPAGWQWVVEKRAGQDDDDHGWEYAWHFRQQRWSHHSSGSFGSMAWVRRRKWVPALQEIGVPTVHLAKPLGRSTPTAPRLTASVKNYHCVVEVYAARGLQPVSVAAAKRGQPPVQAVVRLRIGETNYQFPVDRSAASSPNPVWGDSDRCRFLFELPAAATFTPSKRGGPKKNGLKMLMLQFAHPVTGTAQHPRLSRASWCISLTQSAAHAAAAATGVKVRDRGFRVPAMLSHLSSFVGSKAVNWLTGVHSRECTCVQHHFIRFVLEICVPAKCLLSARLLHIPPHRILTGAAASHAGGFTGQTPAANREAAIEIGQCFLDHGWIVGATQSGGGAAVFEDSERRFYRISERYQVKAKAAAEEDQASSLVIEILDAQLLAPAGVACPNEAKAVIGRVVIPASTLCRHSASEGWHNLDARDRGGGGEIDEVLDRGEIRVAWLLLADRPASTRLKALPSPSAYLVSKAKIEADESVGRVPRAAMEEEEEEAPILLKLPSSRSAGSSHGGDSPVGIEGRTQSDAVADLSSVSCIPAHSSTVGPGRMENAEHAQTTHVVTVKVQACQRMARSYINSGSLAAADACVSTGLELASNDWMLLRLQDEVGFRSAMANESCRNLPSPTVACWAPALGMQLGPMEQQHGITRCSGRYRLQSLYDRRTPWVIWEGNRVTDEFGRNSFTDSYGFCVPAHAKHDWSLAHSHALCLAARARPHWQRLLLPEQDTTHGLAFAPADGAQVRDLIRRYGIPPELRSRVWPQLVGAAARRTAAQEGGDGFYDSLVAQYHARGLSNQSHREQIRKDVGRTLCGQFTAVNSPTGAIVLERLLGAFSEFDPCDHFAYILVEPCIDCNTIACW